MQESRYVALLDTLDKDSLSAKHRLMIARYVVKLTQALHDQQFSQADFKAEDVFVSLTTKVDEPRHDKTNKMCVRPAKTQISLGISPVFAVGS